MEDHDGGPVLVLTGVLLPDGLQQELCGAVTDRQQRGGPRSLVFHLQQLQVELDSDSQQPDAADVTAAGGQLLPGEAADTRRFGSVCDSTSDRVSPERNTRTDSLGVTSVHRGRRSLAVGRVPHHQAPADSQTPEQGASGSEFRLADVRQPPTVPAVGDHTHLGGGVLRPGRLQHVEPVSGRVPELLRTGTRKTPVT